MVGCGKFCLFFTFENQDDLITQRSFPRKVDWLTSMVLFDLITNKLFEMAVKAHHFGKRKTSFGTSMHEITLFRIVNTRPGLYLVQLLVLDMYRPEREFPPPPLLQG